MIDQTVLITLQGPNGDDNAHAYPYRIIGLVNAIVIHSRGREYRCGDEITEDTALAFAEEPVFQVTVRI